MSAILSLLRVLIGFVLACIVFGLTLVLFERPPVGLTSLGADERSAKLFELGNLALLAGTHSAIFAAPFTLIIAGIGEWQRARSVAYYIAAAMVIALLGFYAQYASEVAGQPTVMNNYALGAFLASGLASGLAYWVSAGRYAGRRTQRTHSTAAALALQPLIVETPPPLDDDVVTITKPGGKRAERAAAVASEKPDDAASGDDANDDTVTRFERDAANDKPRH